MRTNDSRTRGGFTGLHMLAIMIAFFGVIIAVNVTMAVTASTSWTGLVVKNTYVASQEFNRKAQEGRAQAALGWAATLAVSDGTVRFTLADADGVMKPMQGGTATFRRPVGDVEDTVVTLAAQPDGSINGPVALAEGAWIVEVQAEAGLAHPYRDTRRLSIRNGAAR
ncbi:FixH family protein [Neoaquamicrobium sediminum]|uniref:FixH family protein n=1 Tax=Neoaquamicrobium sediminum TaxID=1849104 RepID=UPI003BAB02D9